MERLSKIFEENKDKLAIGGGVALSLLSSAYLYKKLTGAAEIPEFQDSSFSTPNLPLFEKEASNRDKQLSNVKYDLIMIVGKQSYSGKVTIKFKLTDKKL